MLAILKGVLSKVRSHTTYDVVRILVISAMVRKRKHSPWSSVGRQQNIWGMLKIPVRNHRKNKAMLRHMYLWTGIYGHT